MLKRHVRSEAVLVPVEPEMEKEKLVQKTKRRCNLCCLPFRFVRRMWNRIPRWGRLLFFVVLLASSFFWGPPVLLFVKSLDRAYALKHHSVLGLVWRCNFVRLDRPLWPITQSNPDTGLVVHRNSKPGTFPFDPHVTAALDDFLSEHSVLKVPERDNPSVEKTLSNPAVVVSYATDGNIPLTHHWACRCWEAGVHPIVIALDSEQTCVKLREKQIPCFYATDMPKLVQFSGRALFASDVFHEVMVLRTLMSWRILSLHYDALLMDADVILGNRHSDDLFGIEKENYKSTHPISWVDPNADFQIMEASDGDKFWNTVFALHATIGFIYGNFGFVWAKSSTRTVAYFQLLYKESVNLKVDDQPLFNYCHHNPFRSFKVRVFDRYLFPNGHYWVYHLDDFLLPVYKAKGIRPTVVHLTWVPSHDKVNKIGFYGLYNDTCAYPNGDIGNIGLATSARGSNRFPFV